MEPSPNITLDMNLSASSSILSDLLEESSTDLTNDSSVLILQTTKKSYQELEQENAKLTQLLLLQLKEVEKQHQTILDENEQLSKENRDLQIQAAKHKEELCKYEALKQRLKLAGLAEINFEEEASSGPISSKDIESNEMTVGFGLESVEVQNTGRYEEIPGASATTSMLPDVPLHQHGVDKTKAMKQSHFCICGKKFNSKLMLTNHTGYFSAKDKCHFQCTVKECEAQFYSAYLLKRHMKAQHDLEYLSNFGCRTCGQTFPSRSQLRIHQWKQHYRRGKSTSNPVAIPSPSTGIKKAYGSSTTRQHGRDLSKANASGRTRTCLCGQKFAKEDSLSSHISYFSITCRNFSCHVCQSQFRHTSSLRLHMKQKHQLNFTGNGCTKCGQLFANMKELIKHRFKVHFGNQATPSSTSSNPVSNGTLAETPITSV